jgi:uncharacterized protein DUF2784
MLANFAADTVLLVHVAFIVFVLAGGLLVLRIPSLAWLHLPAVAWAIFVEATGRICPLTYVENHLRATAAMNGDAGDFLWRYLLRVIYPAGLTHETQMMLALIVVAINVAVYAAWLAHRARAREALR